MLELEKLRNFPSLLVKTLNLTKRQTLVQNDHFKGKIVLIILLFTKLTLKQIRKHICRFYFFFLAAINRKHFECHHAELREFVWLNSTTCDFLVWDQVSERRQMRGSQNLRRQDKVFSVHKGGASSSSDIVFCHVGVLQTLQCHWQDCGFITRKTFDYNPLFLIQQGTIKCSLSLSLFFNHFYILTYALPV